MNGRRLLVTTSTGTVRIFEIGATGEKTPLHPVAEAEVAIEGSENLVRFPLLQGGQFWIADNRLTKYDVLAAKGRLVPNSVDGQDSVYLQPPLALGPSVVTVRRKVGMPGATVCAQPTQAPGQRAAGRRPRDGSGKPNSASPLAAEPLAAAEDGKPCWPSPPTARFSRSGPLNWPKAC